MKVLINAINLKVGGGVTVVTSFLKELIANPDFKSDYFHVLVPNGVGYEAFNATNIKIEFVPNKMLSPLLRLVLDYTWFKTKIKEIEPDVIFTMGNIAIPSSIPQAVLFHFPYAMYPEEKEVWNRLSKIQQLDFRLRNFIFSSRLKYADIIFPQTESAKMRLIKYYGDKIRKIKVIPNSTYRLVKPKDHKPFFIRQDNFKYLLCLSKYYSHKNIEIFIPLAKLIKNNNALFKIVTTVEGDQGPGSQEFLDAIRSNHLEEVILNIGKVPMDSVPSLYANVDGLLLPTLLESFSATYVDSMSLGVPIFTSDRDFARDVCEDAAFYFDPFDENNIFQTINNAFASESMLQNAIIRGQERASGMPNWHEVTRMYVQTLKELNES